FLGIPVLAAEGVEVLAVRPRDVVVRLPVLVHGQMPVEVLLDDGLEFVKQVKVGQVFRHVFWSLLASVTLPVICTCRLHSIYLCLVVTSSSRAGRRNAYAIPAR